MVTHCAPFDSAHPKCSIQYIEIYFIYFKCHTLNEFNTFHRKTKQSKHCTISYLFSKPIADQTDFFKKKKLKITRCNE